jgi:2-methylisocitrate lyase-like PEP mutase family enzyme
MTGKSPSTDRQVRQAEIFASLHRPGDPLLAPNAWDVASAVMIARAGDRYYQCGRRVVAGRS